MGEASAVERLLRRERLVTLAGLVTLSVLAWVYVVSGAGMGMSAQAMTSLWLFPHQAGMSQAAGMDQMAGMSGMPGMAPAAAGPRAWALMLGMWWSMMIAMMTPSAAPAILLYGRVRRHAARQGPAAPSLVPVGAFAAGYLLAWLGFSVAATFLHYGLEQAGLIEAMMMRSQSRWLSAGVLVAAGLYQLSPLKHACLSHCRSPAEFLTRHWRPGVAGAVRMGASHGAYCVGCCWMLMALLFVGGVMNLVWIAALAILVLIEKLVPAGGWVGRAAGLAMIAWGVATLLV